MSATPPDQLQIAAAGHHIRLWMGLETVDDVIRWADSLIESADIPASELIELSLASGEHPFDVCRRLGDFAPPNAINVALRAVFSDIAGRMRGKSLSVRTAIKMVHSYVILNPVPERLVTAFVSLDAQVDLLDSGYSGSRRPEEAWAELYRDVLSFLEGHEPGDPL